MAVSVIPARGDTRRPDCQCRGGDDVGGVDRHGGPDRVATNLRVAAEQVGADQDRADSEEAEGVGRRRARLGPDPPREPPRRDQAGRAVEDADSGERDACRILAAA